MKGSLVFAALALAALPAGLAAQETARAETSATVRVETRSEADLRLDAAREALSDGGRRSLSRREVDAGAEALAAGATRADLARISRSAPAERSLAASLRALVGMRARGVESGRAAAEISARLARGASDRSIRSLAAGAGGVEGAVRATGRTSAGAGGLLGAGAGVTGSVSGGLRGGLIP